MKKIVVFALTLLVLVLNGCQSTQNQGLDGKPLKEIIAGAAKEGKVVSLGMPNDWANWSATWRDLETFYGIKHLDNDVSSKDELKIMQEEGAKGKADLGDVGYEYGALAAKEGITASYKTSYWDEIPTWAKDDKGHWMVPYTGTLAFLINKETIGTKPTPTAWKDLLEGDYRIALGDVIKASQGQYAVYAANLALGGTKDNLEPGISFFKKLAEQGRLIYNMQSYDQFIKSGAGVHVKWDFVALQYRDQGEKKGHKLAVAVPSDASVTVGYASIINKHAPHPYSAALAREYIFSDAGQLNLAQGYATPIRPVRLPEELEKRRLPRSQYSEAMIKAALEFDSATANKIADAWTKELMPILTKTEGSIY